MRRGRLVVHAHFYQPLRIDPWTGVVPAEPSAAPFHDWNARVDAECYRPNAERGNLDRISFDLGPTLAGWLESFDAATYGRFVDAGGNAIAQAFHHSILPLASAADRRTEIAWGVRDFERRFGQRPTGIWLPEAAVDLATLRDVVDAGLTHTILAPWQAAEAGIDTRHPYRVDLGGDRSIVVILYDAGLSSAVSFEPEATSDADRFAREWVAPRLRGGSTSVSSAIDSPIAVIATDGELYGHHQQFRDLFLRRLVAPPDETADRGFDLATLAEAIAEDDRPHPPLRIVERTSWSCHHGVARWSAECPDAPDGRWKGPLRATLERLAGGIDVVADRAFGEAPGEPDPWAARDGWVDVVVGATPAADALAVIAPRADDTTRRRLGDLLDAQRWRLAMFASDGWFWDDPIRPETRQILRFAARAARIVDGRAGSQLESRLVADLSGIRSPSRGLDGAAIYRMALADVGQPGPA